MESITQMVFMFAGGVALFLLGMKLLTDGLKIAAGNTLRTILSKYTSTMPKGILAGILITALVQSSSAVVFATIGFVNAGIMPLLQAVYVIFGSNVGTTLTGWIIATIGFNMNLQLLSMPILAVGMVLWLSFGSEKKGALGQALVGFSVFFLGIDILKTTFSDLGDIIPFDQIGSGVQGKLLMMIIGIMLTTIMQSSSASIAVVITAAASGIIPIHAAAAMVIGADVGTTSTALFAVIGSTSNAKRAAFAHVLFNLLKVPIAFPFIAWILGGIYFVFGQDLSVPVTVAVFHTTIKVLGLIVLLPFTKHLVKFLEKRFTSEDVKPEKPRYLDDTVLNTPSIATSALIFEIKRVGRKTRKLIRRTLKGKRPLKELEPDSKGVEELSLVVGEYIQKMQQQGFPPDLQYVLPQALRVLQYFSEARVHALESHAINKTEDLPSDIIQTIELMEELLKSFMLNADSELKGFSVEELEKLYRQLETAYEIAKRTILEAGSTGKIPITRMIALHEGIRAYRRIWDQLMKAAVYLNDFNKLIEHEPGTGPQLQETILDHDPNEPSTSVAIPK